MTDQSPSYPQLYLLKKLNSLNWAASAYDLCGSVMTPEMTQTSLDMMMDSGLAVFSICECVKRECFTPYWEITDAGRTALKEFQK